MRETEKRLKVAVNNLFCIARINRYMKLAESEFIAMLELSDYALRMFESETEMSRYIGAKDELIQVTEKIKNTFGKDVINKTYTAFKDALDDDSFMEKLMLKSGMSSSEKAKLFNAVFEKVIDEAPNMTEDTDPYTFFVETVKDILTPPKEFRKSIDDLCPYCNAIPKKIAKSEFFGLHQEEDNGYVLGCECGAYALMNSDGDVVGSMGDASLHEKRRLLKGAICELSSAAGLSAYESCRWFSYISGCRIDRFDDVESLDEEGCNTGIHEFLSVKKRIKESDFDYPKTQEELIAFFDDGGRLIVYNAYGFPKNRLLIPDEVGKDGIRIRQHRTVRSIGFSHDLTYEFMKNILSVIHPSGKKEKYRMISPEIKKLLYQELEN